MAKFFIQAFTILPRGGWIANPVSLNSEPKITAVFIGVEQDKNAIAAAINQQTKMYNSNAPEPFENLVYLYGNAKNKLDYQMEIAIDLGGSNYDLVQLSVAENACTNGDVHGNIEVFDFGSGPFTGVLELDLIISGYFGPLNLGLRLEDTSNQSSLYELRTMILPVMPI